MSVIKAVSKQTKKDFNAEMLSRYKAAVDFFRWHESAPGRTQAEFNTDDGGEENIELAEPLTEEA